ncbi:MAG: hypothetical protein CXR30_10070 [Geobacter sp.]|nr:MAG: hypothetical protein CXR30_10070 [Geobacter sp.]
MKKHFSLVLMVAVLVASGLTMVKTASAEELKVVGVITKIDLAPDGKSAVVTLKDNKSGADVVETVADDLTLDKFKDHRIVSGDEIRSKYEQKDGKNFSKLFKKTAGC